jgi:hypothetical protein
MAGKAPGVGAKIIGETFEVLQSTAKTAGQIPGQMADEAKKHFVGGADQGGLEQQQQAGKTQTTPGSQTGSPKEIGVKRPSVLQQRDDLKKRSALVDVRQKIARYQQLQQQIQMVRKKKEEEVPAYVAGKPGEVRTVKEREAQLKEIEAKKEEEGKRKKKEELLSPAAKAKMGTKERVKVVAG